MNATSTTDLPSSRIASSRDFFSGAQSEIQDEVDALHHRYAADLPHKIAHLEAMWRQIRCGEIVAVTAAIDDEVSLPTFYRLVHNLAGSRALYGFGELSEAARALTSFLKPWSDPDLKANSQQPLKRELCECIETLLAAMKAAI